MGRKIDNYKDFIKKHKLNEGEWYSDIWDTLVNIGKSAFDQGAEFLSTDKDIKTKVEKEVEKDITDPDKTTSGDIAKGGFVAALFKILAEEGTLPDQYKSIFALSSEKQVERIGGSEFGMSALATEGQIEAKFNKQSDEEKEMAELQAKRIAGTDELEAPDEVDMGNYKYARSGRNSYNEYKELLKRKRIWDTLDPDEWNLIGIRNTIRNRRSTPDGFIDDIILLSPEKEKKFYRFNATTTPGLVYRVKKVRANRISRGATWLGTLPAKNGVAIMKPGKYRFDISRMSSGRNALKPMVDVSLNRYSLVNTDREARNISTYSPGRTSKAGGDSLFIHGTDTKPKKIGQWSAGCQVIQDPKDFAKLYRIVKKSNGGEIVYTLIEL